MLCRSKILLALLCVVVAACGTSTQVPQQTRAQSLGEPIGEYPSYQERLLLYFTNRARVAPADVNPDDPYPPSAPLGFDYDLTVAARFHARHIEEADCFCEDHSSCCPLDGAGEDVACAEAVTGCGAEDAETRVARFASGFSGENMALGHTHALDALVGWAYSPGHWRNINNPASTRLGAGTSGVAWVQDFGSGGGLRPVIGDGVHFADGAATRFGVTYHQAGSGGPQSALVLVDGECHDLQVAHGVPEQGAFETAVNLEPGCHRYVFSFTDGHGNDAVYPSFGSFGVGVGGAACEFFIDTRPADTCSPSGQTCETGDTRACYTGPFGSENVGICAAGSERCVGGEWIGECRLQTLPADEELCGNGEDDDCNGEVDEGCPTPEDVGVLDAGNRDSDTETTPAAKTEAGGCATVARGTAVSKTMLLMMLFASAARRRRARTG